METYFHIFLCLAAGGGRAGGESADAGADTFHLISSSRETHKGGGGIKVYIHVGGCACSRACIYAHILKHNLGGLP